MQTLGRHVQQPASIAGEAVEHRVALQLALRAVQKRRVDAVHAQAVDLILHQGDERRDDEREPAAGRSEQIAGADRPSAGVVDLDERRRLEAERLAAARRQDDDAVSAREDRLHRLALQRAEVGEAPHAVERGAERVSAVRTG